MAPSAPSSHQGLACLPLSPWLFRSSSPKADPQSSCSSKAGLARAATCALQSGGTLGSLCEQDCSSSCYLMEPRQAEWPDGRPFLQHKATTQVPPSTGGAWLARGGGESCPLGCSRSGQAGRGKEAAQEIFHHGKRQSCAFNHSHQDVLFQPLTSGHPDVRA